MTKLNGFVELPGNLGNVIYIRLSSIDAVWSNKNNIGYSYADVLILMRRHSLRHWV